MLDAIISIEDENFYRHGGVSIFSLIRGTVGNFLMGERIRGGSTITQQLAKNAFLDTSRTITRKVREFVLADKLEQVYTKREILELYLNYISFGRVSGVEEASQWLFGKKASEIDLLESSILASLPKAPTQYSPYRYRDRLMGYCKGEENINQGESISKIVEGDSSQVEQVESSAPICKSINDENYVKGRKDLVLLRMQELGYINEEQMNQAWLLGRNYKFQPDNINAKAPHFVFYVIDQLEEKFGKEVVDKGGLQVETTLDTELQTFAEETIFTSVEANAEALGAGNAALLSVEPETGKILAMVGSKDYSNDEIDGKVNMIISPRQPGSSFKPFIYASAFARGELSPGSILWDVPTKIGKDEPGNFDGTFMGPMSVRKALAYSRNIPAAKAYFYAGEEDYILNFIESFGISELSLYKQKMIDKFGTDFAFGWPIALGTSEIRPIDLAAGYSVFANDGIRQPFYAISKVTDSKGNILFEHKPSTGDRVLDPRVAYMVNQILGDNSARPETWNTTLSIPGKIVAVKTGTSNKKIGEANLPNNAWVAGYTPDVVTVVWGGNSDGSAMKERASGFGVVGPIWNRVMRKALESKNRTFAVPSGITWKKVNKLSGLLATDQTPKSLIVNEVFMEEFSNVKEDDSIGFTNVDTRNALLATSGCEEKYVRKVPYIIPPLENNRFPEWQTSNNEWTSLNKEFFLNQGVLPGNPLEESSLCGGGSVIENDVSSGSFGISNFSDLFLTFSSPEDGSMVLGPSLDVLLDAPKRPSSIEVARVFINNKIALTSKTFPLRGSIDIGGFKAGDKLKISGEVVLPNADIFTKDIEVTIGTDDKIPPVIRIENFPDNISQGQSLSFKLITFDRETKVNSVSIKIPEISAEWNYTENFMDISLPLYQNTNFKSNRDYKMLIEVKDLAGNSGFLTKGFGVK